MNVCAVIPAYNVADKIQDVVRNTSTFINTVIVVDDGSIDATYQRASAAGAIVLRHEVNRGKGAALRTGFEYALRHNFGACLTMDGDGQHDHLEIPSFMEVANEPNVDIIIGSRMRNVSGMPLLRLLTNRVASYITSRLTGQRISDSQSGYRLIKSRVLHNIELTSSRYEIESELLIKASRRGFRIKSIPVETIYTGGASHINKFMDTLRFLRLVFKSIRW